MNEQLRAQLEKKLLAGVKKLPNGDWLWTGSVRTLGGEPRGIMYVNGQRTYVHRLAAMVWLGMPSDSKLQVNHKCGNPLCINPQHLYLGTQQQNIIDQYKGGARDV